LLLEEFIASELECTLEEIPSSSGTETSQKSTSTFLCDNLSESTDETSVVCDGVELYSCLDAARMLAVICRDFEDNFEGRKMGRSHGRTRTYTSTGVRPPWVTEQQTAPAKANLE
jgi:hypothetical protein